MFVSRPLWLISGACLLAGAGWWLTRDAPQATQPATGPDTRQFDYYVRGLTATSMDADGRPSQTLQSADVRHFPSDDTTELGEPRLTIHQAKGPPWRIRADKGWVNADGSLILLSGDVRIEREAGADNRPVLLITDRLRIRPKEDYAETDEPVRVNSENSWVEAVGMQAWLRKPQRVKLLSKVKGHYVAQE